MSDPATSSGRISLSAFLAWIFALEGMILLIVLSNLCMSAHAFGSRTMTTNIVFITAMLGHIILQMFLTVACDRHAYRKGRKRKHIQRIQTGLFVVAVPIVLTSYLL